MSQRERKEAKEASCTICMEKSPNCSLDGCSHTFCFRCIQKWSKTRNTCPLCRNPFRQLRRRNKIIQVQIPPTPVRAQRPVLTRQQPLPTQSRIVLVPMLIYPQMGNVYFQTGPSVFVNAMGNSSGFGYPLCSPTFFVPSI